MCFSVSPRRSRARRGPRSAGGGTGAGARGSGYSRVLRHGRVAPGPRHIPRHCGGLCWPRKHEDAAGSVRPLPLRPPGGTRRGRGPPVRSTTGGLGGSMRAPPPTRLPAPAVHDRHRNTTPRGLGEVHGELRSARRGAAGGRGGGPTGTQNGWPSSGPAPSPPGVPRAGERSPPHPSEVTARRQFLCLVPLAEAGQPVSRRERPQWRCGVHGRGIEAHTVTPEPPHP